MTSLVKNINGKIVTSSKDVADTFGKAHLHVLRDIKKLVEKTGDFGESNFGLSTYLTSQNKRLPCYYMTKDGFTLLAMGYGTEKAMKFKIGYIEQFNAMQQALEEGSNLLTKINKATLDFSEAKDQASGFGRGLSNWRYEKVQHEEKIKALIDKSQLMLNLISK